MGFESRNYVVLCAEPQQARRALEHEIARLPDWRSGAGHEPGARRASIWAVCKRNVAHPPNVHPTAFGWHDATLAKNTVALDVADILLPAEHLALRSDLYVLS